MVSKGLAREEEGGAIRFIAPKTGKTSWTDKIGNKLIEFENKDIEDFIILKSDGYPTYHLANIIDDHAENITHVIRGEDWIPSAPKHMMLYRVFGWDVPEFAHVPNILGSDHKKLSKRRGAKSVLDFKNEGYLPEALLNYLMLLGWSPKDDREILSKDEIINLFSLEAVNVAPAIFDPKKLDWINGEYIRSLSNDDLRKRLSLIGKVDERFLDLAKSRMKNLKDYELLVGSLINSSDNNLNENEKQIAGGLKEKLSTANWNKDAILEILKNVTQEEDIKMQTIYKIFTGRENGLPLPESLEILGKEESLKLLS